MLNNIKSYTQKVRFLLIPQMTDMGGQRAFVSLPVVTADRLAQRTCGNNASGILVQDRKSVV